MKDIKKGHTVELEIAKMAFGGLGIARLDGLVVFVRGAVPGDRIRGRVVRKKKDYLEAKTIELLEPSPDRSQPPCPYSGHCGGCQWQHVRYDRQLAYKGEQVKETLGRIGALQDIQVRDVRPSQRRFGYRNKMEFTFSDRRWVLPDELPKPSLDSEFALGLHVPGTFHKVIDIDACLLQPEEGNQILRAVKDYVKGSGLPVYGLRSHRGFWRFLALRHSSSMDEWMVNVITSEEHSAVNADLTAFLTARFRHIRTVVNNINTRRASIAVGERETVLHGDGIIKDYIGTYGFQISANSFFQTNTLGGETLYRQIADYAELQGSEIVLDLYSGTGTIPVFLSDRAGQIVGVEIGQSAVRDAERNCHANDIHNCEFLWGDIRESLMRLKIKPDVVILDPPRAGVHKDAMAPIMGLDAERIVYVSCNPTTLARDLEQMGRRYDIVEIQPVDMFPHTYHIETVVKLHRRK
jgi:23S rRNA (uracil1939-C5)-methyltransferase